MTIAWVFPGQGSQVVGMGHDLYRQFAVARDVFEQADAILDLNIARLCFEGPDNALTATENAQPALLTVSMAILRILEERAVVPPVAVAGHSLGEYSAVVAAEGMDFATALRLVRRRGVLMAEAHEGTMAAIMGIDEQLLGQICHEVSASNGTVVVANYNAPSQLVISGEAHAVEWACSLARERGAKRAIPLKVSAAFHSPLMGAAAEGMAEALEAATITDLTTPLIANVTAESLRWAGAVRRELMAQIIAPVHWIASVRYMVDQGVSTFVEIGPGKVLTNLIKRIAPEACVINLSNVEEILAFAVVGC